MRHLILIATLSILVACTGESERYENIKKLRAFGVASDPVSSAPSTATDVKTITLTFFAALPAGKTATAEAFSDDASKFSIPLTVNIVAGSEAYEDHKAFRIFSVKATAVVPTNEILHLSEQQKLVRLRYGVKITSESEVEKIVGNVLVYQDNAPELAWATPQLSINNPAEGSTITGRQDISLNIDSNNDENFRVSWFVNDGKVKNRRGIKTEWEPGTAGDYTMIATIRGLKSGAFQYKIVDFTVN